MSGFIIPVLIFVFIAIFVIILTYVNYLRVKKLVRILKDQASKRNGYVTTGFFVFYPSLKFKFYNDEVKVYTRPGGKNSSPSTILFVYFKYPVHQNMVIYKESYFSKFKKLFGMQDIQFDVDYFDDEVVIKGSDEKYIHKIMTFEMKEKILDIIRKYKACIVLDSNKLEIYIPKILYEDLAYDELISTALKLTKKVRGIK